MRVHAAAAVVLLTFAPEAAADASFGPHTPDPTKVVAPGLVTSIVFGEEPAFAIGADVQYIAFDREVSSIRKDTVGSGAYGQSQLYVPFGSTPLHVRHALGLHALRAISISDTGSDAVWTQFRFGGAFRHAAGNVDASYGPEAQPLLGAGEFALVWLGLRFTPPLERAVGPRRKTHGWEAALSLGLSLPIGVGGWPYGTVS